MEVAAMFRWRGVSRRLVAVDARGRIVTGVELAETASEEDAAAAVEWFRYHRREPLELEDVLADAWQYEVIYLQGGVRLFAPGPPPRGCCHGHDAPPDFFHGR
ncbi:MAG TPA: hypothetical protein VNN07_03955 [Candidatus Tectomicrobia bacterium]|nr:hypothetical protein [Candidatus Tectomicrobia bacterium]